MALPNNTTLIISNDEMKGIIELVKSLEDSGLLLKGVVEPIENEAKEQKRVFLSMVLDALLGNVFARKWLNRAGERAIAKSISEEAKLTSQDRGIVRAGFGNKKVQRITTKNKMDF